MRAERRPPEADESVLMSKPLGARPLVWGLALLVLAFLLAHLAWERHDGLAFPDRHIPLFLKRAAWCLEWFGDMQGRFGKDPGTLPPPLLKLEPRSPDYPVPGCFDARASGQRGELIPPSLDYPPLVFLIAAAFMAVFGPEVAVARWSQMVFVAGLIGLMGRVGWKVAGSRGAVLLALGVATAVWTAHFTRIFCMAPAQMFILALMLNLILDSEGLTRQRTCVALGLAFGVGMLIKYSVLALTLPAVLLAASPRLFQSARSRRALLALVLLLAGVVAMTLYGIRWSQADPTERYFLPLVLGAQVLFLGACGLSWGLWRRDEPGSGVGLLTVASVAGAVCSAWYFSRFQIWKTLIPIQTEFAPMFSQHTDFSNISLLVWAAHLRVTETFYWGGILWLALGSILLRLWGRELPRVDLLLKLSLVTVLAQYLLLWPNARYQAPMLPVLVILAFLWAARWRASFVACVGFMLVLGVFQVAGWVPSVQWAAEVLGIRLVAFSQVLPDSSPPAVSVSRRVIPIAEPPSRTPPLFEVLSPGSRVGYLKMGIVPWEEQDPLFFRAWISLKQDVVFLDPEEPIPFADLDEVVAVSWRRLAPEKTAALGLETEPLCIPVLFGRDPLYFHIFPIRKSEGAGSGKPSDSSRS